jgi:hypothetical protein
MEQVLVDLGEILAQIADLGGELGHGLEASDGFVDFADGALNIDQGLVVAGPGLLADGPNLRPLEGRGGGKVGVDGGEDFDPGTLEGLPEAAVAELALMQDDGFRPYFASDLPHGVGHVLGGELLNPHRSILITPSVATLASGDISV